MNAPGEAVHGLRLTAGTAPPALWPAVGYMAGLVERMCAERGLAIETVLHQGGETAPRSVDVWWAKDATADELTGLLGTHAVRLPKGARGRRRVYVAVAALFSAPDAHAPGLPPETLRWETCRASGPGGQHVNKTESAVRLTHLPTGLSVRAAAGRSQHQNRALALRRLRARLVELSAEQQKDAQRARWLVHHQAVRRVPVASWRMPGA